MQSAQQSQLRYVTALHNQFSSMYKLPQQRGCLWKLYLQIEFVHFPIQLSVTISILVLAFHSLTFHFLSTFQHLTCEILASFSSCMRPSRFADWNSSSALSSRNCSSSSDAGSIIHYTHDSLFTLPCQ